MRRISASDVGLRGDVEVDRVACGEPKLVEPAHVLRVGDRDPQRLAVEGERDRADALEHGERDQPGSPPRRCRPRRGRRAAGGTARRACGRCPSELARPSSISACENEPPSARARTFSSLSGGSRPVSPTSSAISSLCSRLSGAGGRLAGVALSSSGGTSRRSGSEFTVEVSTSKQAQVGVEKRTRRRRA